MQASLAQHVSDDHPLYLYERRWHQASFSSRDYRWEKEATTTPITITVRHDDVHVYNDGHEYEDHSDSD